MPPPINPNNLIVPGADFAGQLLGAVASGTANRAQRRYNDRVAWRERLWALEDWNRQNEYNSPAQQMARLKAAGLNPNLVYGHGADATATQMPRSTDSKSYNPHVPRFDLGTPVMNYFQAQLMQKEMEKKDAEIATGWNDAALRAAQVLSTLQGTEASKFDLGQRQRLADTAYETATQHLANMKTENQVLRNRDEREAAMNAQNLRSAAESILNLREQRAKSRQEREHIKQQIENLKSSKVLADLEAQWMREGKTKGDWYFWRFLNDALGDGEPGGPGKKINKAIRENLLQGWGLPE